MIICNTTGGFGNHLLCVALAIIISDKYNIKIKIIGNGNGLNDFSKDTRNTIFKIINKNIITNENHNHNNITINNKTEYYEALNNYNYNFNYIINCIHINELNIYKDNIYTINNNILINKTFDYDYENTITISLRLGCKGEVVYPSPFADEESVRLPFNYFSQGINTIKKNNPNINTILICCDNFEDEFIKQFEIYKKSGFNIIFNKKDTYHQFCDIINSKYFITSLSTFSLWGVLLNNNNCYVPCFNHNLSIKKNIGTEAFYINASSTFYNMKNVTRIYI
jgi:hypothetical protein